MDHDEWSTGIQAEVDFWTTWLETKGLNWPEEFKIRSDPNAELRGLSRQYLDGFPGTPKILDVGAGPVTVVGKRLNGKPVDLVTVDALGAIYDRLPFPPGLPIVRTQQCETEKLREKFEADTFDLTYAENTLDHSYDPLAAIMAMIEVTKPGAFIATAHAANEAVRENWQGFHQWNFHAADGDFKISNRTDTFSVSEQIAGTAEIVELTPIDDTWVNCVMRKIPR